ncbi:MAG: DNA repair protein RadA [Actinomycetaceae bacterium]|nr:DNA repair protein RadA [Actinomycetaceae bacterium]
MAKNGKLFSCSECGWSTTKWLGQCSQCHQWGTIEEDVAPPPSVAPISLAPTTPALPITEVPTSLCEYQETGISEFDRVLGGGIVGGGVILIAGEPGIGKSTLLLDVAAKAAEKAEKEKKNPVLYITGEESASQVRLRAGRIGALHPYVHLAAESDLSKILGHISSEKPSLVIIDSVQTIVNPQSDSSAGSISQVKSVSSALVSSAKLHNIPTILVGHVNKEGSIAGPRVLEHLVDVVCHFEGDRHSRLRTIRSMKNRYGPTDEVGCFELTDTGIKGLVDPSGLFLSGRNFTVPGTCVTIIQEGRRPIPVEVQALTVTTGTRPSRVVSGIEYSRANLMIAVAQSRLNFELDNRDVFISTVGGAKAYEPAADGAIVLALASAYVDLPLAPGVVCLGEISLTGEFRPISGLQQRINEAARLGFTTALIPASSAHDLNVPEGITVKSCKDILEALHSVLPIQK